jgi:hypothetical protein
VAPSCVLFRNRLGGTVVSMSYHFGMLPAYRYSEARQRFVNDALDAAAGMKTDNMCMNAQNVLALSRRAPDGSDLVLLQNLNYDEEDAVLLRRRVRPASIELMDAHGTWRPVPFSWSGGTAEIPGSWPCYGVKFFRISAPR